MPSSSLKKGNFGIVVFQNAALLAMFLFKFPEVNKTKASVCGWGQFSISAEASQYTCGTHICRKSLFVIGFSVDFVQKRKP